MRTKRLTRLLIGILVFFALSLEPRALSPVYAASKGNPPVAHWKFDEGGGTTAYDESANNNDGTLVNHAKFVPGKIGKAVQFDGTDDYVDIPNNTLSNQAATGMTFSAWVKPNNTSNNAIVGGAPTSGYSLYASGGIWLNAGKPTMTVYTGSAYVSAASPTTVTTGQWYHIAGTYNPTTDALIVYVNGVNVNQTTASNTQTDMTESYIGMNSKDVDRMYFNGLIDDVKIYNYDRSADQVLVDYNAGSAAHLGAGTDPNEGNPPVGYWPLDENAGTTTYDRSGNGNNGTLTNGPTWVQGKNGPALSFDGTNDYVDAGSNAILDFGANDFTASAWINARTLVSNGDLGMDVMGKYVSDGYGWFLGTSKTSKLALYIRNLPEGWLYSAGIDRGSVTLSQWHYIVGVKEGANIKFYYDGKLIETTSTSAVRTIPVQNPMKIGYIRQTWDGLIDDVRIYNYARTPAQIAYDYNRGKPVAYYKFDEGGGGTVYSETASNTIASGGTITDVGGYRIHTFTTSGTFTVTRGDNVEVLVVAGGGGTGFDVGGGGGGGGVVYHPAKAVTLQSYTVTVGAGGASGQTSTVKGSNGGDSIFGDITAIGGGGGGAYPGNGVGLSGGSGGGAGDQNVAGGSATQGNSGGGTGYGYAGGTSAGAWGSGGGGGAGGVGSNGITGQVVNGGPGYVSSISGSNVEYGKGGKGNSDGGTIDSTPANTGQGAMGTGSPNNSPYSGGSGIVVIRYLKNYGTLVGDTKFVDGKIGKALQFDGSGDYVDCGTNSAFNITGPITVETWANFNDLSARSLVSKWGDDVNSNYSWLLFANLWNSGEVNFLVSGNGTGYSNCASGAGKITTGNWYHIAGVYDTSSIKLYINGNLVATNSSGIPSSIKVSTIPLQIGVDSDGASESKIRYFNGKMDDVRIYNYARTAEQILQDYNAGATTRLGAQSAGEKDPWGGAMPVGWWKLDENTGVLAQDASGNGNNGTLTNGPTWTQGKNGPCLNFDGQNDYVDCGSGSSLAMGTGSFTLEAWINSDIVYGPTWNEPIGCIMRTRDLNSGSMQDGYYLGIAVNTIFFQIGDGSVNNGDFRINYTYTNSWHHIAAVRNAGTEFRLYLDGVLTGTDPDPCGDVGNTYSFNISGGSFFDGKIDDVRVYNYARTQAQIAWDYNAGKPVAHYRFDEATSGAVNTGAGAIKDETAKNNGTASNTTWTYATGKFGGALNFDGNDYVSCGSVLTGTNTPFTASAWVNPADTTTSWKTVFAEGCTGFDLTINGATINFGRNCGGGNGFYSGPSVTAGVWTHLVIVYDGTNLDLYKDGIKTTGGASTYVHATLSIGCYNNGGAEPFKGLIDDVRIYNYARTADQIQQDYLNGAAARLGD